MNTAADELGDLERMAQEAVESMDDDGADEIPPPTHDIKKLNISLPERLLHKIDAAAEMRHMSRSAFLAMAAQHEMEHA